MFKIKRVRFYNIKSIYQVAGILNRCGKDMADKYDLHHWDNPMVKTMIIVVICLLKNNIYLITKENKPIATFQISLKEDVVFFEKLAVEPSCSGSGCGSYCMNYIEEVARKYNLKKIRMEVYDKSQHAIQFYLNKGYKRIGTVETRKYTDFVMEKEV